MGTEETAANGGTESGSAGSAASSEGREGRISLRASDGSQEQELAANESLYVAEDGKEDEERKEDEEKEDEENGRRDGDAAITYGEVA